MKAKHTDCLLIRHDALGLLMKHTVWSVDFDTSILKMHDAEIMIHPQFRLANSGWLIQVRPIQVNPNSGHEGPIQVSPNSG